MQLQSLNIRLDEYGIHKGRYVGTADFKGQYGSVQVVIHPEASDAILKICAEALVRNSRELADTLTAETLTQVDKALPAPEAPSYNSDDIPL